MDAFRSDLIDQDRTPFLARLRSEGISFTDAVATGPGTSSAFPGIMAGVLPLEYGYATLREEHTTIAEQIGTAATTVGLSSSTPTSRIYSFDRGFDVFVDTEDGGIFSQVKQRIRKHDLLYRIGQKAVGLGRRLPTNRNEYIPYTQADEMTDTVREMVHRYRDEDLFLWAHYMDTHTPYHPPDRCLTDDAVPMSRAEVNSLLADYYKNKPPLEYDETDDGRRITDAEMDALWSYYEAEARFVDEQMERAFDAITEHCDSFVIVICADHGEEFGEHGHHGHQPKVYQELVHVPLIVYDSEGQSGTVDHPVSVGRVPATVTDVLDIEPASNWDGDSLLTELSEPDRSESVFSELTHAPEDGLGGDVQPDKARICVRDGKWKYTLDRQCGTDELFDLEADPGEKENLIEDEPAKAGELRSRCRERLDELTRTETAVETSEDVNERLEDLGYL